MKIILITGNHPRHKFIAEKLYSTGRLSMIISEKRGKLKPEPPVNIDSSLLKLFNKHFDLRITNEYKYFGENKWPDLPLLEINNINELSETLIKKETTKLGINMLISYGCSKIEKEIVNCIDGHCWNMHGGLSPWYKGSITHFWPSYMLEPQMTGFTIHELTESLDAGPIIHQCVADLEYGQSLHELACDAIVKVGNDLTKLISLASSKEKFEKKFIKTQGRIWTSNDWRLEHLFLIYDLYKDRIVDSYLNKDLKQKEPNIYQQNID